ncbi:hypothetical protein H9Q13_05505 [Pontibacter sp. JH31]|uniref:Lipoprotein n=1 Tax=Pontibacter aquaedesilientis TaxID=2766980 RepID=A0ABR7XEA0_9BACT|nr:hypothetical protein [Pontibacter aquaedesilientis]MBD1396615.1 hypothetical protein [Pontibacter aquaedesilientis]
MLCYCNFYIACLVALLWLAGCGSKEQNLATAESEEEKRLEEVQEEHLRRNTMPGQDSIRFKTAFTQFLTALHNSDTTVLNQFIHPDYGVWVIEQPGAMPKMTHVTDIRRFRRDFQDRSFFTVREEVKECDLKEEVWPRFDCGDMDYEKGQSGYSKEGCFAGSPDKFQRSGYWDYASLSNQEIDRVKSSLPLLQKSVLHTATSFEFHFGQVDGQWRLLFTKLIYPCSA